VDGLEWYPYCRLQSVGIVVSNPAGDMESVRCKGCVLSRRGLWEGLITRPE